MKLFLKLMLLTSFVFPAYSAVTVGKVDIQKILLSIDEGQTVRGKLKKSFDSKQKLLKSEEDKIRKSQQAFQKKSALLSGDAKLKEQKKLQQTILDLQQKTSAYQREIQKMEQDLKRPILEKIRKIVVSVSKKAKVDFTIEVSTSPVLYAQKEKDLTNDIVKSYNKLHPVKKKK